MNAPIAIPPATDAAARQRRLELARRAMQEMSGQANWYVNEHWTVSEDEIPAVIRKLRLYGGDWGYKAAAELMS